MRRGLLLLLLIALGGCSREWYRRDADRETYHILDERRREDIWPIANDGIDRPPASRLHDPFNPNYPPMPPDDPAADQYMRRVYYMKNSKHFHDDGDALFIEDPDWLKGLELDADGKLVLTPDRAVELGTLHSREYQTAREQLYLAALVESLNRFDFDAHWFGTNTTIFDHFGSSETEVNTLTTNTDFGFTRNFAAGGQLIFDIANSFVFTFSGINQTVTTTNIGITFIQPLLRGFGRRVRLEQLTEGERRVLYAVRDYARFRKIFYVNLTTQGGGYMSLLLQLQNTRDLESNLKAQENNLRLNEALQTYGSVSIVQVDQAFQSYLQAKLALLQSETGLQSSLDQYKLTLGLPPSLPVQIDDALLKPFQLTDPELARVQGELDAFFAEYREMKVVPTIEQLQDGYARLKGYHVRLLKLLALVEEELRRWQPGARQSPGDEEQAKREQTTHDNLSKQLPEIRKELARLGTAFDKAAGDLLERTREKDWERLQRNARAEIAAAAELFVVQNQVRVYLIELKPVPAKLDEATAYARDNRLDLMNERGRVVDAWRQVAVTADALRAGLTATGRATIATPPGGKNPVDFRASASDYQVGLAFDSPLNRMVERNAYRTAQINYQSERRTFIGLDDRIQASIRLDLRNLETERASFVIARQSLISAARQVEITRDRLLLGDKAADTTISQDVLTALNSLLQAKATLISSWISYETTRIQLLLDMEALQVDERGLATDEHDTRTDDALLPLPKLLPGGQPAPGPDAPPR
jgi:outer membrane protein TolC